MTTRGPGQLAVPGTPPHKLCHYLQPKIRTHLGGLRNPKHSNQRLNLTKIGEQMASFKEILAVKSEFSITLGHHDQGGGDRRYGCTRVMTGG